MKTAVESAAAVLNVLVCAVALYFWTTSTPDPRRLDATRIVFTLYTIVAAASVLGIVGRCRRWPSLVVAPCRALSLAWAGFMTLFIVVMICFKVTV